MGLGVGGLGGWGVGGWVFVKFKDGSKPINNVQFSLLGTNSAGLFCKKKSLFNHID